MKRFACILPLVVFAACSTPSDPAHILVFTAAEGYRHASTDAGVAALRALGAENNFSVEATDDPASIAEPILRAVDAVVFLHTTGDVLNYAQEADLERFIQAGGGFVGIHSAIETETDWPWFTRLVGARYHSHPAEPSNVQTATLRVANAAHPATEALPATWSHADEWPNFADVSPDIQVLLTVDESSYQGGTHGEAHPAAWYQAFDGGRSFYTAGGHTAESFDEPEFRAHLLGGLRYAIGEGVLDYSRTRTRRPPEERRFVHTIFLDNLDEPTELELLPDGRILFTERKGALKLYDPATSTGRVVEMLEVNTTHEDGLMGIALDPNYATNNWIYLYYSVPGDEPIQQLSRFVFDGQALDHASEKKMLQVRVQRQECCHTGGSIEFGPDGNLFLSTGDNTNPFFSDGFAPIDERAGRHPFDGQGGPGNTNDLRGKILRITPQADGTYTIPEGNLFPVGDSLSRPEIYVMGNRNPYRISIDQKTGFLYWGEVGPDAGEYNPLRGPRGHDEVNQARQAGNFGWPYFVGDNKPYRDYNFATGASSDLFDTAAPINDSPNNTGRRELPPAQKAFIWYPYAESPEFPIVGTGGRNAMAGPVFYTDLFTQGPGTFPEYFDGKLFIYDWIRGWVLNATMDDEGDLVKLDPFMPGTRFRNPIDMMFSDSGVLYLLEYGTGWFTRNVDARLSRITYERGNLPPEASATADRLEGATPLTVAFSAGATDPDGDTLSYAWHMLGDDTVQATAAETTFTFEQPGTYRPTVTVTDAAGATSTASLTVRVGNEPPAVTLALQGNTSFFTDGRVLQYAASATDKEDGAAPAGAVVVQVDYLEQGFDRTIVEQGHRQADAVSGFSVGQRLIEGSDCMACHVVDRPSIGPSYQEVAKRYAGQAEAEDYLVQKIIQGGGGVWGEQAMAAHPQLAEEDARAMVRYIRSLGVEAPAVPRLPAAGTYRLDAHRRAENTEGMYFVRAAFTDAGAQGIEPITGQQLIVLRHPKIEAEAFDRSERVLVANDAIARAYDGSFIAFDGIDLTGVTAVTAFTLPPATGTHPGRLELRLDAPDGPLVGTIEAGAREGEVRAAVQATEGVHDLFVVFRANRDTGHPLARLDWLRVELGR